MKDFNLLVFVTQLGLSVALPPAVLVLLALWLQKTWNWGNWVIIAGVVLGILFALAGLRSTLKVLTSLAKPEKVEEPPLAFNDHD